MNAAAPRDAWRVAALSMMAPAQLRELLGGGEAASWVEAAASCGMPEAQVRLGRMLLEGTGVARDARAEFACFLCAAEAGDADGQNMLGRCYENGWGIAADVAQAAALYREAAQAGLAWAQYNLGHLLLDGNGVARDPRAAFAWYRCAAAQGQFWKMRDAMGANPDKLDMNSLAEFALDLKLNVANFRSCVESGKYKAAIRSDSQTAEKIGANGTPSFVLGKSTPEGVDGELIIGAMPYEVFDQKIKALAR